MLSCLGPQSLLDPHSLANAGFHAHHEPRVPLGRASYNGPVVSTRFPTAAPHGKRQVR